jgi:hypothetical protein
MTTLFSTRVFLASLGSLALVVAILLQSGCNGGSDADPLSTAVASPSSAALVGDRISPLAFSNPYAHIPAQCHIETSAGTQNACQYCHNNGLYLEGMGNNPQAGLADNIGNLQTDYSFAPYDATAPLATINRWENTLFPEMLLTRVKALGLDPATWNIQALVREDNWTPAYAQRGGKPTDWNTGVPNAWQVFPGLDPADLPAKSDGFVRSTKAANGYFKDGDTAWITGWRAINFMPYGIFTPMTGSVSGIYVRLPKAFMQGDDGSYDLAIYRANLDLLEKLAQDRLSPADGQYFIGAAKAVVLEKGVYPVGTEFAHPLHYVDVAADGTDAVISSFPGTRARRVKEIRYMYKWQDFRHTQFRPGDKEEGKSIYGNDQQGWIDNGAGWYLAGWIEDAAGKLRPQKREEMMQCLGCHSAVRRTENPSFTSGTGNTVDSTWALPRKLAGNAGWQEMNYLGYRADRTATPDSTPGHATLGDPFNRRMAKGEFRHFLETVVGASLFGDMPAAMDRHFATAITRSRGYSADWPVLNTTSANTFQASQKSRQTLMREFTGRRAHLRADGSIEAALMFPPANDAIAAARRYRQVVVSQSYHQGKDVFPETPVTVRYFRRATDKPFGKLDGSAYALGEAITERPVHAANPASINYRLGSALTLIDPDVSVLDGATYNPDYSPLLDSTRFE